MANFQEQVDAAIGKLRGMNLARQLRADIDGKTVTLLGETDSMDSKTRLMNEFNGLVKTDNTFNKITIAKPAPAPAPGAAAAPAPAPAAPSAAPGAERVHVVAKNETLSHISLKYYGNANKYMKIFEANKDVLKDPDKIREGMKLRIP